MKSESIDFQNLLELNKFDKLGFSINRWRSVIFSNISFSSENAIAIADGIRRNKYVNNITFKDCEISDADSLSAFRIIMSAIKQDQNIESLTFNNCTLGEYREGLDLNSIADTILDHSSIKALSFENNQLGKQHSFGLKKLFDVIAHHKTIQTLKLEDNGFGYGPVACNQCIANCLIQNKTITTLSLAKNNLEHSNEILHDVLVSNHSIQDLSLQECNIALEGAKQLGEALKKNKILKRLDISGNHLTVPDATSGYKIALEFIVDGLIVNQIIYNLLIRQKEFGSSLSAITAIARLIEYNRTIVSLNYDLHFYDIAIQVAYRQNFSHIAQALETNFALTHLVDGISEKEEIHVKGRVNVFFDAPDGLLTRNISLQQQALEYVAAGNVSSAEEMLKTYKLPNEFVGRYPLIHSGSFKVAAKKSKNQKMIQCVEHHFSNQATHNQSHVETFVERNARLQQEKQWIEQTISRYKAQPEQNNNNNNNVTLNVTAKQQHKIRQKQDRAAKRLSSIERQLAANDIFKDHENLKVFYYRVLVGLENFLGDFKNLAAPLIKTSYKGGLGKIADKLKKAGKISGFLPVAYISNALNATASGLNALDQNKQQAAIKDIGTNLSQLELQHLATELAIALTERFQDLLNQIDITKSCHDLSNLSEWNSNHPIEELANCVITIYMKAFIEGHIQKDANGYDVGKCVAALTKNQDAFSTMISNLQKELGLQSLTTFDGKSIPIQLFFYSQGIKTIDGKYFVPEKFDVSFGFREGTEDDARILEFESYQPEVDVSFEHHINVPKVHDDIEEVASQNAVSSNTIETNDEVKELKNKVTEQGEIIEQQGQIIFSMFQLMSSLLPANQTENLQQQFKQLPQFSFLSAPKPNSQSSGSIELEKQMSYGCSKSDE